MSGMIANGRQQIKWDLRFLELAKFVSTWSKDPSTQVGAVIADQKILVSVGYNGFPAEVEDRLEWYNDRDKKLSLMTHAEINALNYVYGPTDDCTLYTYPFLPCCPCAEQFTHRSGIIRVVAPRNTVERWEKSINEAKAEFERYDVEVDDCYEIIQRTTMGQPTGETYFRRITND